MRHSRVASPRVGGELGYNIHVSGKTAMLTFGVTGVV